MSKKEDQMSKRELLRERQTMILACICFHLESLGVKWGKHEYNGKDTVTRDENLELTVEIQTGQDVDILNGGMVDCNFSDHNLGDLVVWLGQDVDLRLDTMEERWVLCMQAADPENTVQQMVWKMVESKKWSAQYLSMRQALELISLYATEKIKEQKLAAEEANTPDDLVGPGLTTSDQESADRMESPETTRDGQWMQDWPEGR